MSVADAVTKDLAALEKVSPGVSQSTLAASALVLARELDTTGNSATSKSMCARALLETMDRLRELAPQAANTDRLDELAKKRANRKTA